MSIKTVGVAGLGFMGRGIVASLLAQGVRVVGYDTREQSFDLTRKNAELAIEELIERLGYPATLRDTWQANFIEANSPQAFTQCDAVIESIIEDADAKSALFDQIEAVVGEDVVIASNTSALPITQLQQNRKHPERFVGLHFCEPVHVTRFLEVIRGEQTSDAAFNAAMHLGKVMAKDPSLVQKDIDGFIINRLGYAIYREAMHLLEQGVADAETIDRTFRNVAGIWGMSCGPFRWIELTGGLPLYAKIMERMFPKLASNTQLPDKIKQMAESGEPLYDLTDEQRKQWEDELREATWIVRKFHDEHFPLNESTDEEKDVSA